jgi:hypothetical protein
VTGTITAGGTAALTVSGHSMDEEIQVYLWLSTSPIEVVLTSGLCPNVNQWYTLVIHSWDTDADHTTKAVTFRRVEE